MALTNLRSKSHKVPDTIAYDVPEEPNAIADDTSGVPDVVVEKGLEAADMNVDVATGRPGMIIVPSSDYWGERIRAFAEHPENLYSFGPREFEALIAELLRREGMIVRLTPATRDGGFDIYATTTSACGPYLCLVECKRYAKEHPVGVDTVRSLCGTVAHNSASNGLIVTTSRFTSDALYFANMNQYRIALKDFERLIAWLRTHSGSK
ncbi:MAG TPA: restriction endonuclease [Candidatus Kapabacteria bacterium]|nr:restriction endonuclease [Candidatus Kapabacteria bacterium]